MRKAFYLLCFTSIGFLSSCQKTTTDFPYQVMMKANVNGEEWSTTNATARYDILGTDITLVILGQTDSNGRSIALHVENYGYGKGLLNFVAKHDGGPEVSADAAVSNNFSSFDIATSGQLHITNVTNQVIQGTFYFKGPGATVSDGSFTVRTPK